MLVVGHSLVLGLSRRAIAPVPSDITGAIAGRLKESKPSFLAGTDH